MAIFNWSDNYSVGVREMDNQHKVLINLLNELFDSMKNNTSKDKMGNILTRLLSYTKTHFAEEEKYMKQYGYPGLEEQKRAHTIFVDKIAGFKRDFESGKIAMTVSVTSFLKDWLINHISGTDKKYKQFFNDKGLK